MSYADNSKTYPKTNQEKLDRPTGFDFSQIQNYVFNFYLPLKTITPLQKNIIVQIEYLHTRHQTEWVDISLKTLAEMVGSTVAGVKKARKALVEKGIVKHIVSHTNKDSDSYSIQRPTDYIGKAHPFARQKKSKAHEFKTDEIKPSGVKQSYPPETEKPTEGEKRSYPPEHNRVTLQSETELPSLYTLISSRDSLDIYREEKQEKNRFKEQSTFEEFYKFSKELSPTTSERFQKLKFYASNDTITVHHKNDLTENNKIYIEKLFIETFKVRMKINFLCSVP